MIDVSAGEIVRFQDQILSWYATQKRDLPWRKTQDPYKIFVSEMMLQQTQVDRVIPKYHAFLDRFPDIKTVACASTVDILSMRSGLGYNRRALYIQKTSQAVLSDYSGVMPSELHILRGLPGIGPYTVAAICAFAYNQDVPVIDINIKRVLIHLFDLPLETKEKDISEFAQKLIPSGYSRDWHNALMDYGSLVLTSKKTGIASPTQSKFEGSTRWVRGGIIKYLLAHGPQSMDVLYKKFSHEKFDQIVTKMIQEGLITMKGDIIAFV